MCVWLTQVPSGIANIIFWLEEKRGFHNIWSSWMNGQWIVIYCWVCESEWRFEGKESKKKIYVNSFCSWKLLFILIIEWIQMFGNATHAVEVDNTNTINFILFIYWFIKIFTNYCKSTQSKTHSKIYCSNLFVPCNMISLY